MSAATVTARIFFANCTFEVHVVTVLNAGSSVRAMCLQISLNSFRLPSCRIIAWYPNSPMGFAFSSTKPIMHIRASGHTCDFSADLWFPNQLCFEIFFTSNVWASTSCCIHKYLPAMCFILPDPVFWVKNRAPLLSNRRLKPVVLDVKKFTAILDEQCIWNTWTCWIPFGFCGTTFWDLLVK